MKTSLLLASVLFVVGCVVALGAHLAGLISFDLTTLPLLIGGSITSALLGQLFSDYSRRPRFRVRRTRPQQVGSAARPAAVSSAPATLWTYTIRKA